MATSLENYLEQIIVLVLKGSAALATITYRENEDAAPEKDRVIVRALPRQPELMAPNGREAALWKIPVEITVHAKSRDESDYDALIAAVESAMDSTAPAGAVSLATTHFPNGLQKKETPEGESSTQENTRTRSRTFEFLAPA